MQRREFITLVSGAAAAAVCGARAEIACPYRLFKHRRLWRQCDFGGSPERRKLEAALKCRSCRTSRSSPSVNMIKLTKERKIDPYLWVHPDEERWTWLPRCR
jgi:hypothetical protein